MSEFVVGGAVPIRSDAYVSRQFEEEVFRAIVSGTWVLLLGPRQHGKTTGLVRLTKRFEDAGLVAVRIDLQALPPINSYETLLKWVGRQIERSINGIVGGSVVTENEDDLYSLLSRVVPVSSVPVVLIVDEAASVRDDDYRNSFYGQIREMSNRRADADENDICVRIRFIFAGTFRPETLVQDQNSPFNVCEEVHTDDLTVDQAFELAQKVEPDDSRFVTEAYELVGGQPFLLQFIFRSISRETTELDEVSVSLILNEFAHEVNSHLEGIFSKVIGTPSLAAKVALMASNGHFDIPPADSDCAYLQILGLARRDENKLKFRNKLYMTVARDSPQIVTTAPHMAYSLLYRLDESMLQFMANSSLRLIALSAFNAGVTCHNTGSFRLALVAFGSAVEALLLDWLVARPPADLATAVATATALSDSSKKAVFGNYETRSDPMTWKLVNLIKVARVISGGANGPEPDHVVRDWRNLIHPAKALTGFVDESQLQHESAVSAHFFEILRRDISLWI